MFRRVECSRMVAYDKKKKIYKNRKIYFARAHSVVRNVSPMSPVYKHGVYRDFFFIFFPPLFSRFSPPPLHSVEFHNFFFLVFLPVHRIITHSAKRISGTIKTEKPLQRIR